jgi:hypothetical protein
MNGLNLIGRLPAWLPGLVSGEAVSSNPLGELGVGDGRAFAICSLVFHGARSIFFFSVHNKTGNSDSAWDLPVSFQTVQD